MLKLYELAGGDPDLRFSPYCWRVRMALAHKGEEAVTIPWRFSEKSRLPGAPATQAVPVLVDGTRVVAGSTSIAFHLEERYDNGPSLFGGTIGEAHARFIIAWTDTVLIPSMAPVLIPAVLKLLHPGDREYFRSSREARLGRSIGQLESERPEILARFRENLAPLRASLSTQAFLGGAEPSYADYCVFGSFQWARCVGVADLLPAEDTLRRWLEDMLDLFDGLARQARAA